MSQCEHGELLQLQAADLLQFRNRPGQGDIFWLHGKGTMFGELDGTTIEQAANRLEQHISSTYVLETYTLCKLVSGCCNAKGC